MRWMYPFLWQAKRCYGIMARLAQTFPHLQSLNLNLCFCLLGQSNIGIGEFNLAFTPKLDIPSLEGIPSASILPNMLLLELLFFTLIFE